MCHKRELWKLRFLVCLKSTCNPKMGITKIIMPLMTMVEASITDKVSEFVYFRSNSIGLFLLQRDTYSKDNVNIYIYK